MLRKFPHLGGCTALRVPAGTDAGRLLRGQLAVSVETAGAAVVDATGACRSPSPKPQEWPGYIFNIRALRLCSLLLNRIWANAHMRRIHMLAKSGTHIQLAGKGQGAAAGN